MEKFHIDNLIDLHCHFGPDTLGSKAAPNVGVRPVKQIEDARENGFKAILLKSQTFPTVQLADTLNEIYPDFTVLSGMTCDYYAGGLNVQLVECALMMGAKIIWMPTLNSTIDMQTSNFTGLDKPGIRLMDDNDKLLPEVYEIFDLCKKYDAVFATGHVTKKETYALVREFAKEGKVLVTHAGCAVAGPLLNLEETVELADMGAMIELTAQQAIDIEGREPGWTTEYMSEWIRAIGPERVVLTTDYGFDEKAVPLPAPGFIDFLEKLYKEGGFTLEELEIMASKNPAWLCNIKL